jgi:cytoskeleton-associated protein 5
VFTLTESDAESRINEVFTDEEYTQLGDPAWKVRLEAMQKFLENLETKGGSEIHSELIVRLFMAKPVWKDNNFQVTLKLFNVFTLLAEKSEDFNKASASYAIPSLIEKQGDLKLRKAATDALTAFAEKTSVQFVLSQSELSELCQIFMLAESVSLQVLIR